ncbi:MAG: thermonuclease family protein, partial [Alphaproteobacteria bacterium]|nr:thermonuclease family protein [Alphaproteobacteria bacterium]
EARAEARGLWAEPAYRPSRAEGMRARDAAYHLVEGRVVKVAETRGKTYLNFGADWRTDFTVTLDAAARRLFLAAGRDPAGLEGRLVRVRGWLESWNGPLIEASHPEQIEVVE